MCHVSCTLYCKVGERASGRCLAHTHNSEIAKAIVCLSLQHSTTKPFLNILPQAAAQMFGRLSGFSSHADYILAVRWSTSWNAKLTARWFSFHSSIQAQPNHSCAIPDIKPTPHASFGAGGYRLQPRVRCSLWSTRVY